MSLMESYMKYTSTPRGSLEIVGLKQIFWIQFKLQNLKKYEKSFSFIRDQLIPYRDRLYFIPESPPKVTSIELILVETEWLNAKKQ